MAKFKLNIALILLLLLIGTSCSNSTYSLATTSPDRKYNVEIREKVENVTAKQPFRYKVIFSAMKNNLPFIEETRIYAGGGFDPRFGDEHGMYSWVSNRILWLGNKTLPTQSMCDSVSIKNLSQSKINFLMVNAGSQRFFVFELLIGESINIHPPPNPPPGNWLGVDVQFADGKMISYGKNFRVSQNSKNLFGQFSVVIKDELVSIQSPDYESFSPILPTPQNGKEH